MGMIKSKVGIFMLILCLSAILAAIWFVIFGFSKDKKIIDGTLVNNIPKIEEMIHI